MKAETALLWSYLNVLDKKRYTALVDRFGDLEKAAENISLEMLQELGLKEESGLKAMNRLEEFDAETYGAQVKKRDLRLLTIEDPEYPISLSEIADPPIFLYIRGDLEIVSSPCIAIVGSRDMTDYGKRVIEKLVPPLVEAHVITVSGLAYGIDAEVAKETLRAGGKTVAVLGHGLGMIYPKANTRLADDIVKAGGLLVSEFPLDAMPDKYTFPARNRIIAGLSLCTVVAEAAEDSGSLITAELALEYNRDVCAVPGDVFSLLSVGCNFLIRSGQARLVTSGVDILQEVGIVSSDNAKPSVAFEADSPDEQSVYDALSSLPSALDDLVIKTKLDAATLNAVLTILELRGVVRNAGSGKWIRA